MPFENVPYDYNLRAWDTDLLILFELSTIIINLFSYSNDIDGDFSLSLAFIDADWRTHSARGDYIKSICAARLSRLRLDLKTYFVVSCNLRFWSTYAMKIIKKHRHFIRVSAEAPEITAYVDFKISK